MQLSDRLQAVASMVTENSRLADVGTDHGYIPIYLCEMGKIPSAIAMDVKKGPLLRAKMNIERYHMQEKIRTRLSDGVLKLNPDEADSVVIAGMGGTLVMKILEEGKKVLVDVKELVLQPQSDIDKVRKYLYENDYVITRKILSDDACAARTYGRTCRHRMEIWSFFIKRKESGSWLFSEKRRDHADWCVSEFKAAAQREGERAYFGNRGVACPEPESTEMDENRRGV